MKPKEFVRIIKNLFDENRNTENAFAMSKYMKGKFLYYGIKKPLRTSLTKPILKELKPEMTEEWVIETAQLLWAQEEREFHYVALDLLNMNNKKLTPVSFSKIKTMLLKNSWWDSVDAMAVYAVAPMVMNYPQLFDEIRKFSEDENFWLRRVSIIYQLGYKKKTNEKFLFEVCLKNSSDNEFFIRKAIGWALRQYAKTEPEKVYRFVDKHRPSLSPLSIREALKHR